jgi:hypothetical protein
MLQRGTSLLIIFISSSFLQGNDVGYEPEPLREVISPLQPKKFIDFYLQTGMPYEFALLMDEYKVLRHAEIKSFVAESEFGYVFQVSMTSAPEPKMLTTAFIRIVSDENLADADYSKRDFKSRLTNQKKSDIKNLLWLLDQYSVNVNYHRSLIQIFVTITEEVAQNCWKQFATLDHSQLTNQYRLMTKAPAKLKLVPPNYLAGCFIFSLKQLFDFLFPPGTQPIKILKPWALSNLLVVKRTVKNNTKEYEFLASFQRDYEFTNSVGAFRGEENGGRNLDESQLDDGLLVNRVLEAIKNDAHFKEVWQIKLMNIQIESSLLTSNGEKFEVSVIRRLTEQKLYFLTVCKWIFSNNSDVFKKRQWNLFRESIENKWKAFYVNRLNIRDETEALRWVINYK